MYEKIYHSTCAPIKDPDESAHPHSQNLCWTFLIAKEPRLLQEDHEDRSDCLVVQVHPRCFEHIVILYIFSC